MTDYFRRFGGRGCFRGDGTFVMRRSRLANVKHTTPNTSRPDRSSVAIYHHHLVYPLIITGTSSIPICLVSKPFKYSADLFWVFSAGRRERGGGIATDVLF